MSAPTGLSPNANAPLISRNLAGQPGPCRCTTRYRHLKLVLLLCLLPIMIQCHREEGATGPSAQSHQRCRQLLAERDQMIQTLKYQRFDQLTLELGDIADTEQTLRRLVPPDKQLEFIKSFDTLTQNYNRRLLDLQRVNAGLRKENRLIQLELHLAKRKLRHETPADKRPHSELN